MQLHTAPTLLMHPCRLLYRQLRCMSAAAWLHDYLPVQEYLMSFAAPCVSGCRWCFEWEIPDFQPGP